MSLIGRKIRFPWHGGGDRPMVFYEGKVTARARNPRWVEVDHRWWACLDWEDTKVLT